ncbi:MAG: hypothetical protein JOY90_11040, partial [Bradyrhizobium sp.]|uniref:hypothetical protein n=1 Tax=Bradyrhizobium sp. TaxID=376 RepID=UPI001DC8210C
GGEGALSSSDFVTGAATGAVSGTHLPLVASRWDAAGQAQRRDRFRIPSSQGADAADGNEGGSDGEAFATQRPS